MWCVLFQDFVHAKQLFAACLELVTEFSPKLRQVMLNEMLLLDIYTHEAGAGLSGERPPSDLISRVRGYLEMRVPGKNVWLNNMALILCNSKSPAKVVS